MAIYRNRMIINQRGSSIDMDNTTNNEKIHISQRSGSNIELNNVVNSELATNNKQTNIVNDNFKTVGKDDSEYVAGDKNVRVGGNSINLKGFSTESQLNAYQQWKETYRRVANVNGEFKIYRGGKSFPNGTSTQLDGERYDNPVLDNKVVSVENRFDGYSGVPVRKKSQDDVVTYSKVTNRTLVKPAETRKLEEGDITKSAGSGGSRAPGVLKHGALKSAATENGEWKQNDTANSLPQLVKDIQDELSPIEQIMGNGGDEINFIKRNKIETIGATLNDYPSFRIDEEGRSQPLEVLVSDKGIFKNHDSIPHVEEIDNSNFPGGESTQIINNKWNVNVGSGGANIKTLGPMEIGGGTLKVGFKKVHVAASHGLHLASEQQIELQSIKSIILRTNRQVYVEGALGVQGNAIVGGGMYVGGEMYVEHITAPLEVHQTEDTLVYGQFATDIDKSLVIGECQIGGLYYPVYAKATPDLIVNYPHSHHHNGIPMRLTRKNSDVRKFAQKEGINKHDSFNQALSQNHERKKAQEA